MVVGTTGPPAVHAAVEVLQRGGSAVDAVMTAALVQAVLAAGSWDSCAGIMSLVSYDARGTSVHALNAGYDTLREERDPRSIPAAGTPSGRTALVPGFMAGVQAAHAKFGVLPFAALFEPAIALADDGFVIDPALDRLVRRRHDVLFRLPEGREVFAKAPGVPYRAGDRFTQPLLAGTLREVARHGAAYMYEGAWGDKLVDAVRAEGGRMTREDLRAYRVVWSEPRHGRYCGFDVFGPGPPGLGGTAVVEALNLLDRADLARYGHYAVSAHALYWLIQITRVTYLSADVEPEARIGQDRARRLWAEMSRRGGLTGLGDFGIPARVAHSDAVVAVDEHGNVAALCHTSNTEAWGTTGIFVDGVSVPDSACFQQAEIQRAGPGARLPDPMNPLIVLRSGRPILASSCVGVSLHELAIQGLTSVLDFDMEPREVARTPTFMVPQWTDILRVIERAPPSLRAVVAWCWWGLARVARVFGLAPRIFAVSQIVEPGAFSPEVLAGAEAMGQRFTAVAKDPPLGYWAGIRIEDDGTRRGAVTPRGGGAAAGY